MSPGLPFPYSESLIRAEADKLPSEHDWRLFGAVTPVKGNTYMAILKSKSKVVVFTVQILDIILLA